MSVAYELLDLSKKFDSRAELAIEHAETCRSKQVREYAASRAEKLIDESSQLCTLADARYKKEYYGCDPYNSFA